MKRVIFPYDFSPYYPVGIQPCPMYVDVANRIYDRIKNMDISLPDADKLKKGGCVKSQTKRAESPKST